MSDISDTFELYEREFDRLMESPIYDLSQPQKLRVLLPTLWRLHQHHQQHCTSYKNITGDSIEQPAALEGLPFLAVRLFKQLKLASISDEHVFKILRSSGTTSQTPATLYLDKRTSAVQSKVLVKIMQQTLGKQRLPMLVIDSPGILNDRNHYSARGAGIQGMTFFGRDVTYALDENMQLNWSAVDQFVEQYQHQPVLVFGFTYMVWLYFVQALSKQGKRLSLPHGTLIHSGGWKKLEAQKVDNVHFKQAVQGVTDISQCYNFYGMAEQVGSVFVECEYGHLHTSVFADVVMRNTQSLQPCRIGEQGIVQAVSSIPSSYPGHSILTEDLGTVIGIDDCACQRKGKYFSIQERLPKTEVRGCSDTHNVD